MIKGDVIKCDKWGYDKGESNVIKGESNLYSEYTATIPLILFEYYPDGVSSFLL